MLSGLLWLASVSSAVRNKNFLTRCRRVLSQVSIVQACDVIRNVLANGVDKAMNSVNGGAAKAEGKGKGGGGDKPAAGGGTRGGGKQQQQGSPATATVAAGAASTAATAAAAAPAGAEAAPQSGTTAA